jgi:para-nitrobenzyl esterase
MLLLHRKKCAGIFGLLLIAALFLLPACNKKKKNLFYPPPSEPREIKDPITLTSGPVCGIELDGLRCYLGIPYASPPVGNFRWAAPQVPGPWIEPLNATEFGPACPQNEQDMLPVEIDNMSEDCLYLNVWTPAEWDNEALPVMVWIHGGGFLMGSVAHGMFNGADLAAEGVVVVTINYRLGKFGFFAHPELTAASPDNASGNWGLQDQIFALEWVCDNIRNFGGDPNNVTIFGESAGGVSVCILMASPLARGLFHCAIAESGAASARLADLHEDDGNLLSMENQGIEFANVCGITQPTGVVDAMRQLTWQQILDADNAQISVLPGLSMLETVCIDGFVLTDTPLNIFKAGGQAKVPFIMGSNKDEGSMYAKAMGISTVPALRIMFILAFGSEHVDEMIALYDVQGDEDVERALSEFLTDLFIASIRRTIRAHAASGGAAYLYHFTRVINYYEAIGWGCFHGFEISYVFGTHGAMPLGDTVYNQVDWDISDASQGYWTRFAAAGDPNGASAVVWPQYTGATDEHIILDEPVSVGANLRKEYCDFIDSLGE